VLAAGFSRQLPHSQTTRTRKSPKQSSSFLMGVSTRTREWCGEAGSCVHAVPASVQSCTGRACVQAEADIDERKMMGSRGSFSSGPRMPLSDSRQML